MDVNPCFTLGRVCIARPAAGLHTKAAGRGSPEAAGGAPGSGWVATVLLVWISGDPYRFASTSACHAIADGHDTSLYSGGRHNTRGADLFCGIVPSKVERESGRAAQAHFPAPFTVST